MASLDRKEGLIKSGENYNVVKKVGKKGDKIEKHSHPEENVTIAIVEGKARVRIDEEDFDIVPGDLLSFDGNSMISAEFLEDGAFFATLIQKP